MSRRDHLFQLLEATSTKTSDSYVQVEVRTQNQNLDIAEGKLVRLQNDPTFLPR